MSAATRSPRPAWLKVRAPSGERFEEVARVLARRSLNTVCRQARCPNLGECWAAGTATVLILGDTCTRRCAFCSVSGGTPAPPDPEEPERVAEAAAELEWRYVVVTSVTRDDLQDGGAAHFARVVAAIRSRAPRAAVELLIPDFGGDPDALRAVVEAGPDVLAHNVETVPRLYPRVRPHALYERSVGLFARARALNPSLFLKSGIMVGLGETAAEISAVMEDLYRAGCRAITIGQYLAPSRAHLPPERYLEKEEFGRLAEEARRIGFESAAAGPLVRSSYRVKEQASK